MYHYRTTRKHYERHNQADRAANAAPCTFCTDETWAKILDQNDTMFIVANRVAYDVFEGKGVMDHLLLIPKRHVESLDELTDAERLDSMALMGQYERQGYCVYARGVGSSTRSVAHQHTHLIRQEDRQARAMLYLKRPYLVIKL